MFGWWKSPLAYCVGIPLALLGAAAAVVLAFQVTGLAFLGGFTLDNFVTVALLNLPVAVIGAAPGLIVGEVINDLANRRG